MPIDNKTHALADGEKMSNDNSKIIPLPQGKRASANVLYMRLKAAIEADDLNSAADCIHKLFNLNKEKSKSAAAHFRSYSKSNVKAWDDLRSLRILLDERSTDEIIELLADLFGVDGPDVILVTSFIRQWVG